MCRVLIAGLLLTVSIMGPAVASTEIVIYGFEGNLEGWGIPDWAKASADYVGQECIISQAYAEEGQHALELQADFPGDRWAGAYVEREVELTDWTPFGRLSADVYIPEDAPEGLKGKLILTVGNQWTWTEMNRAIALRPGQWTEIAVSLKPGSMDWKFFPDDTFRESVRKIGIRIESDQGLNYQGSVFIDNIRLAE